MLTRFKPNPGTNPGLEIVSRLMQALKSGLNRSMSGTGNLGQVQTEIRKVQQLAFGLYLATPRHCQNSIIPP